MGKHDSGYPRVERDFYPTPAWVVAALAEHVELADKRIWESACGDGCMAKALKATGAVVYATDIEDRGYGSVFDFISTLSNPQQFDGVITNPPYGARNRLAVRFAEIGLQRMCSTGGFLALLLPSDFDSAVTRRHLFADCPAFVAKIVLTKRIKWLEHPDKSKTPKENTSWFFWDTRRRTRAPIIKYAPTQESA